MTLLGKTRQDLPFTVCSKFQPTVLEGQLCYSLEISKLETNKSKAGRTSFGLLFLLDHGNTNETSKPSERKRKDQKNGRNKPRISSLNLSPVSTDEHSARFTLNTLESFTDYRAGSYGLSVLKKMTGTPRFMNLPYETKRCHIESSIDCQVNSFTEEVKKECGCVPWAISVALKLKVKRFSYNLRKLSTPRAQSSVPQTPLHATPACPNTAMAAVSPAPDSTLMLISMRQRVRRCGSTTNFLLIFRWTTQHIKPSLLRISSSIKIFHL